MRALTARSTEGRGSESKSTPMSRTAAAGSRPMAAAEVVTLACDVGGQLQQPKNGAVPSRIARDLLPFHLLAFGSTTLSHAEI